MSASRARWNILKLVHLGQYIQGDSVIHRLNPLVKLTMLLVLSVFLVLKISFLNHACVLAFALVMLGISGVGFWRSVRLLRGILPFMLMVILMHIFFTGGGGWRVWFLTVSHQGLQRGIIFSLRLFDMLLLASIFGWTTKPSELASSMEQNMRWAERFHIRDVCTSLLITMRFIPEVFQDIGRIRMAQKARGLKVDGGLLSRIRSVIPLIIPLFIRAFKRADTIGLALELKGYQSRGKRSYYVDRMVGLKDVLSFFILAILMVSFWFFSMTFEIWS